MKFCSIDWELRFFYEILVVNWFDCTSHTTSYKVIQICVFFSDHFKKILCLNIEFTVQISEKNDDIILD